MDTAVLVLLVEDDAVILMSLEDVLKEAGFDLVLASNGSLAMAALDADAGRIQALVTDIHLGRGPTGWDVARRAREILSDMPVVYLDGGKEGDWSSDGVSGSLVLWKPFALEHLVEALSILVETTHGGRTVARQPRRDA